MRTRSQGRLIRPLIQLAHQPFGERDLGGRSAHGYSAGRVVFLPSEAVACQLRSWEAYSVAFAFTRTAPQASRTQTRGAPNLGDGPFQLSARSARYSVARWWSLPEFRSSTSRPVWILTAASAPIAILVTRRRSHLARCLRGSAIRRPLGLSLPVRPLGARFGRERLVKH
jgi:hypothetical protein